MANDVYMKILIFSQYYYPDEFLINEIASELVKRGNEVVVITGLPNYPSGIIPQEYRRGNKRDERIDGVRIVRTPIISRGHNKFKLLLNYMSYALLATRFAKKIKFNPDVVFVYQLTPITQVYPAAKFCRKNHLPLLMYNCDLAPMSGSSHMSKISLFYQFYAWFSKKMMNSCDAVAVTSKSFIEYNHRINRVPIEKMFYLPQHASDKMLTVDMTAVDNGIADFMFAGNIGKGATLDTIVDAVSLLSLEDRSKLKIHIVGDGSYLPTLKQLVSEKGLTDCFVFYGRKPMQEMAEMYQIADALLITLRRNQITVPSKLQTYMTTGKPVFGAMDGSGSDMIKEAACGECVAAENAEGLAERMRSYIYEPQKYEKCGQNGRTFFEQNFTIDTYMAALEHLLLRTIRENRNKK